MDISAGMFTGMGCSIRNSNYQFNRLKARVKPNSSLIVYVYSVHSIAI